MNDRLMQVLTDISTGMGKDFWDNLLNRTKCFPDTDEGDIATIKCIKATINLIISVYLDGYENKHKTEELNQLMSEIYTIQNILISRLPLD